MGDQDRANNAGWISSESSQYGEDDESLSTIKSKSLEPEDSSRFSSLDSVKATIRSDRRQPWVNRNIPGDSSSIANSVSRSGKRSLQSSATHLAISDSECSDWQPLVDVGARSVRRKTGQVPPRCAEWHENETIGEFLNRVPVLAPASALVGPWLWVHNRSISEQQRIAGEADIPALCDSGHGLIATFTAQKFKGDNGAQSKGLRSVKRKPGELDKLRDDILSLAVTHKATVGKWMLFPKATDVSTAWSVVARATADGKLGPTSKVATYESGRSAVLICVYTHHFGDIEDVKRVLKSLERLGLVGAGGPPIYYKCDAYTYLGLDSKHPVGLRASLYSSRDFLGS